MLDYKNIIIIGMKCTGKTGLGIEIAKRLNWEFVDIDKEIKKFFNGKSISEITNEGKDWINFRKVETDILERKIKKENIIISCGGGCGVNEVIFDKSTYFGDIQAEILINAVNSFKILLESNLENIINRFNKEQKVDRPKISSNKNEIEDLVLQYFSRKEKYRKIANVILDTSDIEDNFYKKAEDAISFLKTKTNAVIGFPIDHSLSPDIHNSCYKELKINEKFNFIRLEIRPDKIKNIKEYILKNNLYGISVTTPHKENIIKYLDDLDESAEKIGAVNTVYRNEFNKLIGYNTDYVGILNSLSKFNIKDSRIAILGSGGAAKSAIYALNQKCKYLGVFNRNPEKAKDIEEKFNIKYQQIVEFSAKNFDIIINATSCGHKENECPIETSEINQKHIVFDLIYLPIYTKLLRESEKNGANVIFGTEMLLNQAVKQFEIYTKFSPNYELMKLVLNKKIEEFFKFSNIKSKIFISIYSENINDLLEKINLIKNVCKNIEIRADFLKNINQDDIKTIYECCSDFEKVIFTLRKVEHGGKFNLNSLYHKKILMEAAIYFNFLDIDLLDENLISDVKKVSKNTNIIASYHNFDSFINIDDIIKKMKKTEADIYKIAVKVNNFYQNFDLISHLYKEDLKDKLILIGMGEEGRLSRILCPIFGSLAAFCYFEDNSKITPGQIKYHDLVNLYKVFFENL